MTYRIIYRKTELHVELWPNGTFRSAYVGPEIDITNLLTDEQEDMIAALVTEQTGHDDYGPELGGDD